MAQPDKMAPSDKSADKRKPQRPAARLPKGLRDIGAEELRQTQAMVETIRQVYERYGFEPLETPALEYTDALGKFLPDQDRPNAGVFSFQDEDEQWLSLRYDLTAPLARYVAENFQDLPKPFRRYATGSVFRNEKPGPGRFRQFTQFDADTIGAETVAADAELCMLAADTMEALGFARGQFVVKVNNRKLLDGLREIVGLAAPEQDARWLIVMRALDKYDRLGLDGVTALLGPGRKDESGDFTAGAGLDTAAILAVTAIFAGASTVEEQLAALEARVTASAIGVEGLAELRTIWSLVTAAGYGDGRIVIDPSVVRGLEYYTGPVFEAELLIPTTDEKGNAVRFGAVGGGGRYDNLIGRFTGQKVPATGFAVGVSRLQAALRLIGRAPAPVPGPVVVTVMDKDQIPAYQRMVQTLREAGIRAELYLGNPKKFGRQLEYADKRGAPVAVIQGSTEREAGEVVLKDLIEGAKAAAAIKDNKEWKETRPAQVSVPEARLVDAVREILARHS